MKIELLDLISQLSYNPYAAGLDGQINIKNTLLESRGAYLLGQILAEQVSLFKPSGADLWAAGSNDNQTALVSLTLSAAALLSKELAGGYIINGGTKSPPKDSNIVLITDISSTGIDLSADIRLLKERYYNIGNVISVVDCEAGAAEMLACENVRLDSLYTVREIKQWDAFETKSKLKLVRENI